MALVSTGRPKCNTLQAQCLLSNKPNFVPGISDDLFDILCLWMSQHVRMEGTRVGRFTFLLSCTAVMIVNIHLQLCGGAATQALASCFQLQILEESIIHVLCSNWKITIWKININLWFRITFNYYDFCTGQSNEWEQSLIKKFWSKRGNESKTDKSLTHPTCMQEYMHAFKWRFLCLASLGFR